MKKILHICIYMIRKNDTATNRFGNTLLRWFEEHGRDLPWRRTGDAYAIWLSEVILQQTRINQGLAYWERFMERFPTIESLAAAEEDEVLRLWQGLGYYSRARNLHFAARQIVQRGQFPQTMTELKALKGVGAYTAAAVGSIAFGLPVAAVDGNVYRVLSRYFGIDTPIDSTEGKKLFADLAQTLLPVDHPSEYNQAMMDFGATQCTPTSPHCTTCVLADSCEALRTGQVAELPVKQKKTEVKTRRLTYIYIRCEGMTAIHRRTAGDIWQGLWEPLLIENAELPVFGGQLLLLKRGVKHVLTHRVLLADFFVLEIDSRPPLPDDFIWINEADIDRYAVPRLVELLIESIHENKQNDTRS